MCRIAVSAVPKDPPFGVQATAAAIQFFAFLPNYLLDGTAMSERSGRRPMCYGNDVTSDDFDGALRQGRQFGGQWQLIFWQSFRA